ncbi:MAG: hypothetical protein KAS39_03985, partial [Actinomycetia bacterium]|nr:hypothetical protein [Actinomycetes bacterium]
RKKGVAMINRESSISILKTPFIRELREIKGLAKRNAPKKIFPSGQIVRVKRRKKRARKNI